MTPIDFHSDEPSLGHGLSHNPLNALVAPRPIGGISTLDTSGDKVNGWLVLGEVVAVHIDKLLLKDGACQTAAAHPILRAGGLHDHAQVSPDNLFQIARLAGASDPRSHGTK